VEVVVVYGSAVQTNYKEYNDIDVLVITKKKVWKNSAERYNLISSVVRSGEKIGLSLDIQIVDKKSFVIKGMTYAPTKVGQSPDNGTLENWMDADLNRNGLIDGPFDSWVDKNFNKTLSNLNFDETLLALARRQPNFLTNCPVV